MAELDAKHWSDKADTLPQIVNELAAAGITFRAVIRQNSDYIVNLFRGKRFGSGQDADFNVALHLAIYDLETEKTPQQWATRNIENLAALIDIELDLD